MCAVAAEVFDILAAHAQVALAGPDENFLFRRHNGHTDHVFLARLEPFRRHIDQLVALALGQFRYFAQRKGQQVAIGSGADNGEISGSE